MDLADRITALQRKKASCVLLVVLFDEWLTFFDARCCI